MKFLGALALAGVVHARVAQEGPVVTPDGWVESGAAGADTKLDFIVAVRQQNTETLEARLLDVSDPTSVNYGKHLSAQEVNDLVAPSAECVRKVHAWIGAESAQLRDDEANYVTPNSDFIVRRISVAKAEQLLSASFSRFTHPESGLQIVRLGAGQRYSLPDEVAECVDFASPTTRFPVVQRARVPEKAPIQLMVSADDRKLLQGGETTPKFLRSQYGTTGVKATQSENRQAVVNFLGQVENPSDLQTFFQSLDPEAAGRTPDICGPNSGEPGVEASLDIQYIMAMGNGVSTQIWSTTGQQPHDPQNEPFLKWLTNLQANACKLPIPQTISISYADNERDVWQQYAERVNTEFQKLGAQGVSLMAGSGDGGVAGAQTSECEDEQFIPTFPAASPWITAVGGTANPDPESAASFSSGGFSNYWARPKYQKAAVATYLQTAQSLPTGHYNTTGAGFPDVAAQSEAFQVVVGGFTQPVDGTSCATPTFTGVISLLNDARLAAGKTSLGYLNPLFYANPTMFTDITEGNNPGCNTNGFEAATGWDPITGLGTPLYEKMKAVVLSLP